MKDKSSFRDPSGFIFHHDNEIYRVITHNYKDEYDHLVSSGLFKELHEKGYLISHREEGEASFPFTDYYKIIKPEKIPFINYPYEWSFSQLKDAALLTLKIQSIAMNFGMSLKDASSYNVQFLNGKPIFIDTLSFEFFEENTPWKAYKQFCQHFLAPLVLMSYTDIRLNNLLKTYIDGIPLDLCSKLLPLRSYLKPGLLMHIHIHSYAQKRFYKKKVTSENRKFSKLSFKALLDNLERTIKKSNLNLSDSEWLRYYDSGTHSEKYTEYKKELISKYLNMIKPDHVIDFGANTGTFSYLASEHGANVIACDSDPFCIERLYRNIVSDNKYNKYSLLPLVIDITNPSPAIGWANEERRSLSERGKVQLIMALAVIHHLVISNNIPLDMVADYFGSLTKWLIIEFVPKSDEKVELLLLNRQDIFTSYSKENFESAFLNYFDIVSAEKSPVNERIIYLMVRNDKKNI